MRIWRRSNTPSERELVGLADGSLRGQRRAEIESALESRPDLRSAVAAQRRVLEAIEHAATEPAPRALRARLALARPPARARRQRRTGGLIAAGTAGLAAVVAGIVVGVSGGGAVAQASVLPAAALSGRAPQHAVSQARTGSDALPGSMSARFHIRTGIALATGHRRPLRPVGWPKGDHGRLPAWIKPGGLRDRRRITAQAGRRGRPDRSRRIGPAHLQEPRRPGRHLDTPRPYVRAGGTAHGSTRAAEARLMARGRPHSLLRHRVRVAAASAELRWPDRAAQRSARRPR